MQSLERRMERGNEPDKVMGRVGVVCFFVSRQIFSLVLSVHIYLISSSSPFYVDIWALLCAPFFSSLCFSFSDGYNNVYTTSIT